MARLNDPPQPAGETVEGLKRRFVRQNRELARVNSTQSVRIRNLEAEVSQLLGENVSLREQVIKLHYELDNKPDVSTWERVEDLKGKFEARLTDLGALLNELGNVHNKPNRRNSGRKTSDSQSPSRASLKHRSAKNNQQGSDLRGEEDGRLPPILEDKLFPRRTLNANELQGIFTETGNLTDSPDLGPPPIAHFEEGEAVKLETDPQSLRSPSKQATPAELTKDLESRRRRRESIHRGGANGENHTIPEQGQNEEENSTRSNGLKTGSKRKLNTRDSEQEQLPQSSNDGGRFNRQPIRDNPDGSDLSSKHQEKMRNGARVLKTEKSITKVADTKPRSAHGVRKVLAPKSVNTDPQSPAKHMHVTAKGRTQGDKDDIVRRVRSRKEVKDRGTLGVPHTEILDIKDIEGHNVPPKTPVPDGLDLFSPTISDPSEPRPERGDTPPPPDLGPDSGTGSFGRSSRRSRGSVSYAEPNLRDKMRRPTKDLIDAVGAADRARNSKHEGGISSLATQLEALKIKLEESSGAHPKWETKPIQDSRSQQERQRAETNSPLGNKATLPAAALPASVVTDRRRRASSLVRKEGDAERQPDSGSAAAIAALSSLSERGARDHGPTHHGEVSTGAAYHETSERTSIFDFTSSSPEISKPEGPAKPSRVSRRHSSVPVGREPGKASITISRRKGEPMENIQNDKGAKDRGPKNVVSPDAIESGSLGRAASRRRSMMV